MLYDPTLGVGEAASWEVGELRQRPHVGRSKSSLAVPASPLASRRKIPRGGRCDGLSADLPGFGIRHKSALVRPSSRCCRVSKESQYLARACDTGRAPSFQAAAGAEVAAYFDSCMLGELRVGRKNLSGVIGLVPLVRLRGSGGNHAYLSAAPSTLASMA